MPRISDTSPEAEKVLAECYRRMPAERKWKISVMRIAMLVYCMQQVCPIVSLELLNQRFDLTGENHAG